MPWLLFVFAFAALAMAFSVTSVALLLVCLLVALVLALSGVMQLLARRVESRSGDIAMMVDPVELARMREQAEARRRAAATSPGEAAFDERS